MNITDIKKIDFPQFNTKDASLFVYENGISVPFETKRMFTVIASNTCTRGSHAHRECTQLLIAVIGECRVTCDDGMSRKTYILDDPSQGLLIPPTIWAEQVYEPDSILTVLTDQLYQETDYIRDYNMFLKFKKKTK